MKADKLVRISIVTTVVLLVAAGIAWWQIGMAGRNIVPAVSGITPAVRVGGPWTLTDQTGRPVTDRTWHSKVQVLAFGYRHCPDACPTTLPAIAQALDLRGDDARQVQPLFVTVDPGRDTPEQLARYTALFHPSLIGLTGTPEQIQAVTQAYRVYYAKVDAKAAGTSDYVMDPASFVYLAGRDGQVITVFPGSADPKAMAEAIRAALAIPSTQES